MKLSNYISHLLKNKIEICDILVWYDTEGVFKGFIQGFRPINSVVIDAGISRLAARKTLDEVYCDSFQNGVQTNRRNILVYLPYPRSKGDARLQDPIEVYAALGEVFGDQESEQLKSLALQAMPEFSEQIERLFREGKPTFDILDRLEQVVAYPLIRQALGTQAAVDVIAAVVIDQAARRKVEQIEGCLNEVQRLTQEGIGFDLFSQAGEKRWLELGQYILLSELALDLETPFPVALAALPHAGPEHQGTIFAIADRLRDQQTTQEAYLELAKQVENRLRLPDHFPVNAHPQDGIEPLGRRDTFEFEEQRYLQVLLDRVAQGQSAPARKILADRKQSIWHRLPERSQLWAVVERCLNLLDLADQVENEFRQSQKSLGTLITSYSRENGWHELDNRQRLMEQSIAGCAQADDLEGIIAKARGRYRQVINLFQKAFLDTVEAEGWPPESLMRQTQVFDRVIAPILTNREKVVIFLADALRYEMGQDLAQALKSLGEVQLSSLASALPTITAVGMAALLPGADGALELREVDGELVPYIGAKRLKNLNERLAYLQERYGDRLVSVEISDFLSLTTQAQRERKLKNADLVVIRDSRMDGMGETVSLREARRFMGDLLGDLKTAAFQLVRLGYSYQVITADHGHVLLPEILPGDVVSTSPAGEWGWSKRRFLLGRQAREAGGTRVFSTRQLGIHGDVSELVVPNGFGVYSDGTGYFHGGISLQECILPLIILRANPPAQPAAPQEVRLSYRSPQFTSRVIAVKVWFGSLLAAAIRVRIEVYAGSGNDAAKVGEAAECDARDDTTHEISLSAGQEIQVPVLIDADFNGQQIEIRAIQADTALILSRLSIKNAMME